MCFQVFCVIFASTNLSTKIIIVMRPRLQPQTLDESGSTNLAPWLSLGQYSIILLDVQKRRSSLEDWKTCKIKVGNLRFESHELAVTQLSRLRVAA